MTSVVSLFLLGEPFASPPNGPFREIRPARGVSAMTSGIVMGRPASSPGSSQASSSSPHWGDTMAAGPVRAACPTSGVIRQPPSDRLIVREHGHDAHSPVHGLLCEGKKERVAGAAG